MNECTVCGEEFESGESLQEHLRQDHPDHDATTDDLTAEEFVIAAMLGGKLDF